MDQSNRTVSLTPTLRKLLEKTIIDARDAAESAAHVALTGLAVDADRAPDSMPEADRKLRITLRAKRRQLGSGERLTQELAYEQWHRMFFARFLAENGLLMHPEGVAVTLQECAELMEPGDADAWSVAARYASHMLPGIFREGDPLLAVRLAAEGRKRLEELLESLPRDVFTSDDGLGWSYQFWQTKRKKQVNESGVKIGADELPAVTQLFTEPYMVRFLLQNSLGAWWAARHPNSPLIQDWEYLRWADEAAEGNDETGEGPEPRAPDPTSPRTPAAGAFPGWPDHAAELRVMDPCCGSGHFLVEAFHMLRRMRMEAEGLGEAEAADAVLRDNLFGLEIDARCVQIAAFALALAAWKAGGYRPLPLPHVACSGLRLNARKEEWIALARGDEMLEGPLDRLHALFENAPELGSLIDPRAAMQAEGLFQPDWERVSVALERALSDEAADPVAAVFGETASGMARAAALLAGQYTLVATNVPYLARYKQALVLRDVLGRAYGRAQFDLATAFLERCYALCHEKAVCAVVSPQGWLFSERYKELRQRWLSTRTFILLARLGAGAFGAISGEVVKPVLAMMAAGRPRADSVVLCIDADDAQAKVSKNAILHNAAGLQVAQADQLTNPDHRITFDVRLRQRLLADYAISPRGVVTGDSARWIRCFWELERPGCVWQRLQSTVPSSQTYSGREHIIDWSSKGHGMLRPGIDNAAYGKRGIAVSAVGDLPVTVYEGDLYDNNTSAIVPTDPEHLSAVWAFCLSCEFNPAVRRIDRALKVMPATLLKIPFDLERWQKVADEMGPLPEPHADDPTQWLFKGDVPTSTAPLHVAMARLLGYRWPEQPAGDLDSLAISDGLLCLPAVAGHTAGTERLRAFLAAAYGADWSALALERLLAAEGFAAQDLDAWLRDGFFASHCKLFHNRPFLWHVWDGRKDGFSAIVNYHGLDRAKLDKLIYTCLGDWIARQRAQRDSGVAGADGRLVAALELQKKLALIAEGEPPCDIYVRWKPLRQQPIGWEPDLNDGVRLNIRPFVATGVLRSRFTVHWKKDRGMNPDGSERINDRHYTRAEKEAARREAGA